MLLTAKTITLKKVSNKSQKITWVFKNFFLNQVLGPFKLDLLNTRKIEDEF